MPKKKQEQLDIIHLHKAVFYAYHGVIADEQNLGGKFEVDVDLYCDLSRGIKTDQLSETVDYTKVYECIRHSVLGKKYNLIEALGGAIANGILKEFENVDYVTVRVRKPNAPVKGVIDFVGVKITRYKKPNRKR
jgi:dihydroneopterin aldolase